MLVYNSFEAHVTDTVKVSFKRKNTDLAVIPGGLTFLLQLLNLSLNKLFKDGVRKQWMADGIHKLKELIYLWILQVWKAIPSEMITASLLKCGITNNLDGSQDELVYNSTKNTSKTCLNWTASWNLRVLLFKDTEHFT